MTVRHSKSSTLGKPTRRTALKGGVGAAALAGTHTLAGATPAASDPPGYRRWLIDRTTFGWTQELDDLVALYGTDAFLDHQLDPFGKTVGIAAIDDSDAEAKISASIPTWNMSVYNAWQHLTVGDPAPKLGRALQYGSTVTFYMGCLSKRQLLWVMTDFWSNFFNRHLGQDYQQVYWQAYEHETFYSETTGQALGTFPALLDACVKGGSMQYYLNLRENSAGAVNENYARELLELHTVGLNPDPADGPYAEADVVAAANILTAWRTKPHTAGDGGTFFFDTTAGVYANTTQTVMGDTYAPTGQSQGEALVATLAAKPSTAKHVTRRLVEWFLGDDCPVSVFDRVQDEFELTGGDIPSVLKKLFSVDTYNDTVAAGCIKVRRPLNLATAICRTCNPQADGNFSELPMKKLALLDQLEKMGQRSGFRPSPDGYPGENEPWYGTLHARLEMINDLTHKLEGEVNYGLFLPDEEVEDLFADDDPDTYAARAAEIVTGGALPAGIVSAIQAEIDAWDLGVATDVELGREALALTFSTPFMQFLA